MAIGRSEIERTYERWWLHKFLEDGRQIMKVKFHAPPSGFYGNVTLTLSDGTEMQAPQSAKQFRPTKKYLTVYNENPKLKEKSPYNWKRGVCTGIAYGRLRPMKMHVVKDGTEKALCGYEPELGWEEVKVKKNWGFCKRCMNIIVKRKDLIINEVTFEE